MARVLITGMSGAGKTTLLRALAGRGYRTVDTDYDGWTTADGRWDEPRMAALLAGRGPLAVSGTVENQGRFYHRFDQVVLLSAPIDVLLDRVRDRTDNPYGGTAGQRAEIRRYTREVEPLLRRGATVELDGTRPVEALADEVAALLDGVRAQLRRARPPAGEPGTGS
ncbi:AAA family ATPase [Micromonospora auratinigra]|uniref:Shikimate kinase n=1 Tax=Micromonospora auratinigra TaxID=261654 RepID=A0A1A8ZTY7_9ACTN|nr:AAA family ATPase [Micromonospora auratinigra]SBT47345.1 shikimate kinase [Micromonospora auratinigra]